MCGLVGVLDLNGAGRINRSLLNDMNEAMVHRGPDQGGLHVEDRVGLGHRRLSIIDLSNGQQPLANEDDSVWVAYNGEIYNFQELAKELAGLGHEFRTHCDTEVIVHAWEQWGADCVSRFRGMFAFALWDRHAGTLFLARDRLGVKPMFYAVTGDGFLICASELKSLALHPGLDKRIEPTAIEEYFALGYVPEPKTIYRGALKLPPAHTLTVKLGEPVPAPVEYWDVRFTLDSPLSMTDAAAELLERIDESVRMRMISDVPIGAFLSGGVDSSAVVTAMAKASSSPINTCSISFDDPSFDESRYAQMVAERYATNHRVETVASGDYSLIDSLASMYDEPYADSSAIPTYRVCELARKNVTVALSGDGADESLGGYRRYRLHMMEERIRSMMPLSLRRPLFGLLGAVYPKADWAPRVFRGKTTFQALARDSVGAYLHTMSILSDGMRQRLFSTGFRSELGGYQAIEVFRAHADRAQTDDPLALVQYLDLKTYLVGDINTKVDRASMAHSLEVREPLMDHQLVEWIASLPSSYKLRRGNGKAVFKQGLESRLPHDVLYRSKMGFAVPLAAWFRGPLRQRVKDVITGGILADSGIFDNDYLGHIVGQHQSGARDYSASIWTLLMFDAFMRQQSV